MAKKRNVVGSVCKSKNPGEPDYIKMRESGKTYRLESQAFQLDSLAKAEAAGKLTPDICATIRERINKMPSWCRFDIIELVDKE